MKYPAKDHVENVIEQYKTLFGEDVDFDIYVPSEKRRLWPFSDQEVVFRQNRYFNYISGAYKTPDAHIVYEHKTKKLVLYLPPFDEEDAMWNGNPLSPEKARKQLDVDDVKYSNEMHLDTSTRTISPSKEFPEVKVDADLLTAFDEARAIKDEYEVGLIERANKMSGNCHLAAMSALPIETNERHLHAEFAYHALRQGCKNAAYDPICCAGTNAGILHYIKNDEPMENRLNVLLDAGVEYKCYASDVTRCFPINGTWTKESLDIYTLVMSMQQKTMRKIQPGVHWEDLHFLSHRILINGLLDLGIFKSEYSVSEIFKSNASVGFYPHGLGHMLGMDTHDTGGHPDYNSEDPKLRYLRIRRELKTGMVVTVEPGCYFNKVTLERFAGANCKYIDYDVLERYMPVGGIRIEDDVLVTEKGFRNLTKITSDEEEIEQIVQAGLNKKFHNVV